MSAFHPIRDIPPEPRPAADIRRLLAERPKAIGLAVPGMPMGSPGMEQGGRTEPYVTVLFDQASGRVFARH